MVNYCKLEKKRDYQLTIAIKKICNNIIQGIQNHVYRTVPEAFITS